MVHQEIKDEARSHNLSINVIPDGVNNIDVDDNINRYTLSLNEDSMDKSKFYKYCIILLRDTNNKFYLFYDQSYFIYTKTNLLILLENLIVIRILKENDMIILRDQLINISTEDELNFNTLQKCNDTENDNNFKLVNQKSLLSVNTYSNNLFEDSELLTSEKKQIINNSNNNSILLNDKSIIMFYMTENKKNTGYFIFNKIGCYVLINNSLIPLSEDNKEKSKENSLSNKLSLSCKSKYLELTHLFEKIIGDNNLHFDSKNKKKSKTQFQKELEERIKKSNSYKSLLINNKIQT
jgi:hypothetical protein